MDNELHEVLTSFKSAIDLAIERIDTLFGMVSSIEERCKELEKTLYSDILEPSNAILEELKDRDGLEEFKNSYGEKFSPYEEQLKSIEGEDFDIMRSAYDGYKEFAKDNADGSADEYVDELIKSINAQIENIKKAFGLPEEAKIEVASENGETEVKIEGETVKETVTDTTQNDDKELELFEEELLKQAEKEKK